MPEIVAGGTVPSVAAFLRCLGERPEAAGRALVLLQRDPDGWFDEDTAYRSLVFDPYDPSAELDAYDRGVFFTGSLQVTWEKNHAEGEADGPGFAVKYVGPDPAPDGLQPEADLSPCVAADRAYLLWGTRRATQEAFREDRVRGPFWPLRYPVDGPGAEARLVAKEYHDPVTGDLVAFRFVRVEGVE